jgi:hypothetical protein
MAVPAWVSSTAQSVGTTTTTCTINVPTTAANDILIVQAINGGANVALTLGGTYSGGAFASIDSGGWTSGWGGVWWSRATGNHTGQTVTVQTATDSISALLTRVSGCITTGNPWDTNIASATVAAGANCALSSFNTVRADDLILYLIEVDDNLLTSAMTMNSVTMGNLSTAASSGGADSHCAVANLRQAQAGATGAFAATLGAGTNQGKRATAIGLMTSTPGTVPDVGAGLWVPTHGNARR